MVTEQLPLLPSQTLDPQQPQCPLCGGPAGWIRAQMKYGLYCGRDRCTSRDRLCQHCGAGFTLNTNGAGTRYCSTACKIKGYKPGSADKPVCAWCGEPSKWPQTGRTTWPYICRQCIEPIRPVADRLKAHHVPHERARGLLTDPGCEVCGANLLEKIREPTHGHLRVRLVVDHDHNCCPGVHSCGQCVRGLICHQCNIAAGMLGDDPPRAHALARYLQRWTHQ